MNDKLVENTALATILLCRGSVHEAVSVSAVALGRLISMMVRDAGQTVMNEDTFTAIVALIRLSAGMDEGNKVFVDALTVAMQGEER